MTRLPVRLYASFAAEQFGGNVAGVVYDDDRILTDVEMQGVASDLAAPTTGFVRPRDERSYEVRFFSRTREMDMCGHVTVGVCCALWDDGRVPDTDDDGSVRVVQETDAGSMTVELEPGPEDSPTVSIAQPRTTFERPDVELPEIASLLGLADDRVRSPVGVATGSLRHLLVRLSTVGDLERIEPDGDGLGALSSELDVDTVGVWAPFRDPDHAMVRVRDLCYGVGNPEEAASGTTNAALACWLFERELVGLPEDGVAEITAEQGVELGRPSTVRTRLLLESGKLDAVHVRGHATRILDGHLHGGRGR